MESRFGHDFSQVRVHTDARAAESARAVQARAYTVASDVVFGANEFAPATYRGRELLGHELAHTIQQRNASGPPPSAAQGEVLEASAESAGRSVASGRAVTGDLPACGVGLSRAPDEAEERRKALEEAAAVISGIGTTLEEEEDDVPVAKGVGRKKKAAEWRYKTPAKFMPGGFTDDDIYADANRSRDEDVAAEKKATAERKRRRDIKRGHGSKQQKWEVEFDEDPRLSKNISAVAGPREAGVVTASGVRVPSKDGNLLTPRPFYERRDAAMLAYQGFIHYAEIVESGNAQAALHIALSVNAGNPIPDDRINLRGFAGWAERARNARDNAMLLAMVAQAGTASRAAQADLALQRAESALAKQLGDLIGKQAARGGAQITVEGVGLGGVRVTVREGELIAAYDTIINVSRVSGQGRRIHAAFEAAAARAARDAGLKSAQVAVQNIINPTWKEYLLSLGYRWEMIELQPGVWSTVLVKVI
jgi:hypothetical protein